MTTSSTGNHLTLAQIERLSWLTEEAGEVIQAIGKILRFGFNDGHPNQTNSNNRRDLERELGDLKAAISLLQEHADVSETVINIRAYEEFKNRRNFLVYHKVYPRVGSCHNFILTLVSTVKDLTRQNIIDLAVANGYSETQTDVDISLAEKENLIGIDWEFKYHIKPKTI